MALPFDTQQAPAHPDSPNAHAAQEQPVVAGPDARLIRMANDIGRFFSGTVQDSRSRDEAMTGIADHIRRFWDPRMRRKLFALLASEHAPAFDELVVASLTTHQAQLEPPPAR